MLSDRFQAAIDAIDDANRDDPNRETLDGEALPKEIAYARRMTRWLERLAPDASELLRLAVRAQHIRRWSIARDAYPMDRKGYLRWRTDLARFHAETVAGILRARGYDADEVARVQALVQKKKFRSDPEAQTLEDAACLVFLESYFSDFATKHDDAKLANILRKSWAKMSAPAQQAALALDLPPETRRLVERALAS